MCECSFFLAGEEFDPWFTKVPVLLFEVDADTMALPFGGILTCFDGFLIDFDASLMLLLSYLVLISS